jgi:predicted dehydrogenase
MKKTRRAFLNDSSRLVAAGSIAGLFPHITFGGTNQISKIRLALIGANSQGNWDLVQALKQPGVVCVAICDIDETVLAKRIDEIAKMQGLKPVGYSDHRKMLENKDIDAVIIGTPDHWHCLHLVDCVSAGKDVYVEKPIANSIYECDQMVKAVRKFKRIVQVGQQQRSGDHWATAMEFMKQGKIGDLRKINIWANFNYGVGQPKAADSLPPAGVDFDRWLGPAPARSFNRTRFHGSWRMFWDYGGGLMTDWGVHLMDMALWAKDTMNLPAAVSATGGNFSFPSNAHETFDTMSVQYAMPGYNISYEHTAGVQTGPYGKSYGLSFVGNDATIVIDRGSWDLYPEGEKGKERVAPMSTQKGTDSHGIHLKNWIDCLRSRKEPICPIETGRLAAVYCHMGNVALRSQTMLKWNDKSKDFGDNHKANAFIKPTYRKPWILPTL